jgi:hypothetical protein
MIIHFILELVQHLSTYKWFALTSLSNPGVEFVETGICPDSLLSDKSNQKRSVRKPSAWGMLPVNLFEFRALCESNLLVDLYHLTNRIISLKIFLEISVNSYRNVSCLKLPISCGMLPVKLHPTKILKSTHDMSATPCIFVWPFPQIPKRSNVLVWSLFLQSCELLQISNIRSKWTSKTWIVRQIPACSSYQ